MKLLFGDYEKKVEICSHQTYKDCCKEMVAYIKNVLGERTPLFYRYFEENGYLVCDYGSWSKFFFLEKENDGEKFI